jgi:hypothetical protein
VFKGDFMKITQASLVIVGANTPDCAVYWKGQLVPNVVGVSVINGEDKNNVVLRVKEDSLFSEMQSESIVIRRVS